MYEHEADQLGGVTWNWSKLSKDDELRYLAKANSVIRRHNSLRDHPEDAGELKVAQLSECAPMVQQMVHHVVAGFRRVLKEELKLMVDGALVGKAGR